MFRQVFIVQSVSTGEFIGFPMPFTTDVSKAALFNSRIEAIETAIDALHDDFRVFAYYKKVVLEPSLLGGGKPLYEAYPPQVIRGERTTKLFSVPKI